MGPVYINWSVNQSTFPTRQNANPIRLQTVRFILNESNNVDNSGEIVFSFHFDHWLLINCVDIWQNYLLVLIWAIFVWSEEIQDQEISEQFYRPFYGYYPYLNGFRGVSPYVYPPVPFPYYFNRFRYVF